MGEARTTELLSRVVAVLNDTGVPFMIAGSFASRTHGVERATQDLEIVIDPSTATLDALIDALPRASYHGDAAEARQALVERSEFSVVDLATASRIDFIVKKDRPFSRAEMERRVPIDLAGVTAFVVSAEDTIVAELEWSKLNGGSETQLRNAAGILARRDAALDLAYVKRWVDELGLAAEWVKAAHRAAVLS